MLGADGVAGHEDLEFRTALNGATVIAAPGVGFQICVFKLSGTMNPGSIIELRDSVPTVHWTDQLATTAQLYDHDPYGIFTLPDNESLILTNVALSTVRLNITYEIRPTGM